MNILKIKEQTENIKGKQVEVKINIGRNKYEYFKGEISETYPYLFIIRREKEIKSFSYSDILTKTLIVKII